MIFGCPSFPESLFRDGSLIFGKLPVRSAMIAASAGHKALACIGPSECSLTVTLHHPSHTAASLTALDNQEVRK